MGNHLVIEDGRREKRSMTFAGLDADLLRCLLDDVYTPEDLARKLNVPCKEVHEKLTRLREMEVVAQSNDLFIALPTRS